MMVALLMYAYARGNRSARGIERACVEDVAYRVVAGNLVPDHSTIAEFRCRHERALGEVFSGVLGLCARVGLASVGVVAIDGTKMSANASMNANRDFGQIARDDPARGGRDRPARGRALRRARGDELPEHLRTREGRRQALREAKERLERERDQAAEPARMTRTDPVDGRARSAAVRDASAGSPGVGARGPPRAGGAARARRAPDRRGTGPSGSLRRAGAWSKSSTPTAPPSPPMSLARARRRRRRVAADGARHGQAVRAARGPDRADQRHRSRLARGAHAGPAGDAGLQRAARGQRPPDHRRRRDHDRVTGLRAPRTDGPRHPARARARSGSAIPRSCSPTPATGISARCNRSPARASRCSSRPTPGCAGRAAGLDRRHVLDSCAACSRHPHGHDALPPTPDHDRARVRPDQVQPRDQTLPTPRQNRLSQRMATDRRHPQPAQAPPPPPRRRDTMIAAAAPPPAAPPNPAPHSSIGPPPGFTRQPRLVATASSVPMGVRARAARCLCTGCNASSGVALLLVAPSAHAVGAAAGSCSRRRSRCRAPGMRADEGRPRGVGTCSPPTRSLWRDSASRLGAPVGVNSPTR